MIDLTTKFGRKVARRLKSEQVVWFTTVGQDLTPQPRPVWFMWDGASFLIYSQPNAFKVRHIRSHQNVALNFNSDENGDEIAVITGSASVDESMPAAHLVPAYLKKYRKGIAHLKMTPQEFSKEYSVAIRVVPAALRGF